LIIVYFDLRGVDVTFEALVVWMLHLSVLRVATLHLTSACYAQSDNRITSLDGAVFPALRRRRSYSVRITKNILSSRRSKVI
jgi:hypothetical protein